MGPRILLVDDEASIVSTLKVILETKGYAVVPASSAAQALAALSSDAFDLVLTDLKMEREMAGYEVVRAARAQPYHPRIVILTAFPVLGQQWRAAGAHAMVVKPIRMDDLLKTLSDLLMRRQARKTQPEKRQVG